MWSALIVKPGYSALRVCQARGSEELVSLLVWWHSIALTIVHNLTVCAVMCSKSLP